MTLQECIENKLMWKNDRGNWCRKCPKCPCEITHVGKQSRNNAFQSHKKLVLCKKCGYNSVSISVTGKNHPMYGRKHTKKTKNKTKMQQNNDLPICHNHFRALHLQIYQVNGVFSIFILNEDPATFSRSL